VGISNGPTVNEYGLSLVAGDQVTWPVPANAGVISSYITIATPGGVAALDSVNILFRANNLAALRNVNGDIRNLWTPLPTGTAAIKLTNNTASTINVSLTLGIDG
jgi:hypothetical protein